MPDNVLYGGLLLTITAMLPTVSYAQTSEPARPAAKKMVPAQKAGPLVTLIDGAGLLTAYESSPGKQRLFCRCCGSPVFSRRDDLPDTLRIRAGLINEPLQNGPLAHFYTDSKCNWWPIADELPCFAEGYVQPGR